MLLLLLIGLLELKWLVLNLLVFLLLLLKLEIEELE
jgi:hypothetical protein